MLRKLFLKIYLAIFENVTLFLKLIMVIFENEKDTILPIQEKTGKLLIHW